jgi:hypothetical protein
MFYILLEYCVSSIEVQILFKEIITIYCESHTEHTNILCGKNAEFLCVELSEICYKCAKP